MLVTMHLWMNTFLDHHLDKTRLNSLSSISFLFSHLEKSSPRWSGFPCASSEKWKLSLPLSNTNLCTWVLDPIRIYLLRNLTLSIKFSFFNSFFKHFCLQIYLYFILGHSVVLLFFFFFAFFFLLAALQHMEFPG